MARVRSNHRTACLWLALITVGILGVSTASAYEHRRGTPSVGLQIQYGRLAGDSEIESTVPIEMETGEPDRRGWQDIFDEGDGVTVRLRRYITRDKAVGASFEQQTFLRRVDVDKSDVPGRDASFDEFQLQLFMLDFYQYFFREKRRTPYLVGGGGLYKPQLVERVKDANGIEGEHAGFNNKEGFVLRLGGGLEWFITHGFSIDGSLSGYYLSAPGRSGKALTGQASIGLHLYVGT